MHSSEVGVQAWPHVEGVNIVFSNKISVSCMEPINAFFSSSFYQYSVSVRAQFKLQSLVKQHTTSSGRETIGEDKKRSYFNITRAVDSLCDTWELNNTFSPPTSKVSAVFS